MVKVIPTRKPPMLSDQISVDWRRGKEPGATPAVSISEAAIDALVEAGGLGAITSSQRRQLSSRVASTIAFYLMVKNVYRAQRTQRQKAMEYAALLRSVDRGRAALADLQDPLIGYEIGRLRRADPRGNLGKQIDAAEATIRTLLRSHQELWVKTARLLAETRSRSGSIDERLASVGASKPALALLIYRINGLWFKTIDSPHSPKVVARHVAFARQLLKLVGIRREVGAVGKQLRKDARARDAKTLRHK